MQFRLYNSLTGSLIDVEKNKTKQITWYTCGPTIYDKSHIGHARTFICFDVIRRVFESMGYNVLYVMNITDIDDKILNKVAENNCEYETFIKNMEQDFWKDMDALKILRPNVVTRVTEYMEEIKNYIQKLIDNGLTYTVNGSIYFDTTEYTKRGFTLDPFKRVVSDAEYTECEFSSDKKSKMDFVLWKQSKANETISFDFNGIKGRCGWHTECVAMSSAIIGESMYIHSGGCDLMFPHHSNEIVQHIGWKNEEYNPVKIFLHTGHLNINGLKMSKSLKNFISIQDFLQNHGTAQHLRLMFLYHNWNKTMDFSDNTLNEAKTIEKRIIEFLQHIEYINKHNKNKIKTNLSDLDKAYLESVSVCDRVIYERILDNIDTRGVMEIILSHITTTYKYLEETDFNITFVNRFTDQVTKIFNIFGLDFESKNNATNEKDKYIDCIVDIREQIRKIISDKNNSVNDIFDKIFFVLNDTNVTELIDKKTYPDVLDVLETTTRDIYKCITTYHKHYNTNSNDFEKQNIRKDLVSKLFVLLDELRDKKLHKMGVKIQDKSEKTKWVYY